IRFGSEYAHFDNARLYTEDNSWVTSTGKSYKNNCGIGEINEWVTPASACFSKYNRSLINSCFNSNPHFSSTTKKSPFSVSFLTNVALIVLLFSFIHCNTSLRTKWVCTSYM